MMNAIETMKTLTYGTELEYTGITRQDAAQAVQSVVGGTIRYARGSYDAWEVVAPDGRIWSAMSDGSLGSDGGCEVVTPILHWEDMDTLQEVVRALRRAGAMATSKTSQHVHVGCKEMTPMQIANVAKIWCHQEELILKALGTLESRLEHYTHRADDDFLKRLRKGRPTTKDALSKLWFGHVRRTVEHYDNNRYHALNLNNVWRMKTIEFRAANGTTHAGEVKAHIILYLAITAKAILAKKASCIGRREYNPSSAKFDMRVFLIGLGLNGDEFKNTRMHLLKLLPGNAAWKNTRQAA